MKKKILCIGLIVSLCMTGCGKNNISSTNDGNLTSVSSEVETNENSVVQEDNSAEETSTEINTEYNKAPNVEETAKMYAEFLKDLYENDPDTMYRMHYDLVYIDDDEVPELVYMEDNYHAATVHLCLAYEDGVYEVGEFGQYGMFSYVPKKGGICSFYMGMGTYLADYYILENRTLQEEKYFEMSEDINDSSNNIYYIDGDEVDADTYNKESEAMSNRGFATCDYYAAFSYEDSYDVLKILTEYATTGTRPHAVEITDEIKSLEGSYHAIKYGPDGSEIKDIDNLEGDLAGMYGGLSLDGNSLVSIWYGNEDKSFADYAMPISKYMEALSIVETGGLFGIRCLSEDTYREYLIYSMPDGTVKMEIFDSRMTFDAGKVTFILERDIEE